MSTERVGLGAYAKGTSPVLCKLVDSSLLSLAVFTSRIFQKQVSSIICHSLMLNKAQDIFWEFLCLVGRVSFYSPLPVKGLPSHIPRLCDYLCIAHQDLK